MVEEIRNKWCDDLEDLLQCPVCMERPRNLIYQCVQGHHICQICKPQLGHCPTCTGRWSESRNRLAEHLCSKLDEIKLSLVDPENEINKLLIPDKVSTETQTDENATGGGGGAAAPPAPKKLVDSHSGPYPCRIGSCNTSRFYDQLVKHLVVDHAPQFSEIASDGPVFQHTWPFDFAEQMTFDQAFLIPDMGTFFLKLSSDIFGNFTGFILMAHNGFIAKHFTYQLEISCCPDHTCPMYTGEVCSCRTPATVLRDKSLQISRKEIEKVTSHKKRLNCTLLLGKKPVTDDVEHPKQNVSKKKNKKNRHNNAIDGNESTPRRFPDNGQNGLNPGPSGYNPNFYRQPPRPPTAFNNPAQRFRAPVGPGRQPLIKTTSMTSLAL